MELDLFKNIDKAFRSSIRHPASNDIGSPFNEDKYRNNGESVSEVRQTVNHVFKIGQNYSCRTFICSHKRLSTVLLFLFCILSFYRNFLSFHENGQDDLTPSRRFVESRNPPFSSTFINTTKVKIALPPPLTQIAKNNEEKKLKKKD